VPPLLEGAPWEGIVKHKVYQLPAMPRLDVSDIADDAAAVKRKKHLYRDIWRYVTEDWDEAVRAFQANPCYFTAWRYIQLHPMFWRFEEKWPNQQAVDVRNLNHDGGWDGVTTWVMRVDPATGRHSADSGLNTRTEVWLEAGEFAWPDDLAGGGGDTCPNRYHNPDIDAHGATMEEATVAMARNIWRKYGNDRKKCAPQWHDKKRAKQDARLKKRYGGNVGMARSRPYRHVPCAWERLRGPAGEIAASLADIRESRVE